MRLELLRRRRALTKQVAPTDGVAIPRMTTRFSCSVCLAACLIRARMIRQGATAFVGIIIFRSWLHKLSELTVFASRPEFSDWTGFSNPSGFSSPSAFVNPSAFSNRSAFNSRDGPIARRLSKFPIRLERAISFPYASGGDRARENSIFWSTTHEEIDLCRFGGDMAGHVGGNRSGRGASAAELRRPAAAPPRRTDSQGAL